MLATLSTTKIIVAFKFAGLLQRLSNIAKEGVSSTNR